MRPEPRGQPVPPAGLRHRCLTIGQTHEPHIMRLTMVVDGSKTAVEQVVKQLYKVIEVRKVSDLTEDQTVERELALIKVTCKSAALRAEIMQMVDIYRARVVDVAPGSLMVEVTGPTDKIDSMVYHAAAVRHQGDGPDRPGRDGARRRDDAAGRMAEAKPHHGAGELWPKEDRATECNPPMERSTSGSRDSGSDFPTHS